jgi:hypothetical protein
MKLTRSEFVEVCDALARQRAANEGRGEEDKRGGARMTVENQVFVATVNPDGAPGESFTALTRDISFAGVGLVQHKQVARNSLLIVRLPRKGKKPLVMLCKAIHVRELADGVFTIGAEFVRETTIDAPSPAHAAEIDRVKKAMMG